MKKDEWSWKKTCDDKGNERHVVNGRRVRTAKGTQLFLDRCAKMDATAEELCGAAVTAMDKAIAYLAPESTGPADDGTNPMEQP